MVRSTLTLRWRISPEFPFQDSHHRDPSHGAVEIARHDAGEPGRHETKPWSPVCWPARSHGQNLQTSGPIQACIFYRSAASISLAECPSSQKNPAEAGSESNRDAFGNRVDWDGRNERTKTSHSRTRTASARAFRPISSKSFTFRGIPMTDVKTHVCT